MKIDDLKNANGDNKLFSKFRQCDDEQISEFSMVISLSTP